MKSQPLDNNQIIVRPATPDRWKDVRELFSKHPCWCQYWRVSSSEYGHRSKSELDTTLARRSKALRTQMERPTPPGVIAYVAGQAAGWCGFGPRAEMIRLVRSRTIPTVDDLPVWSIVCFLVYTGFRRRGVAQGLLRGAVQCAREHGAPALEAYPVDANGRRIDVTFAYVGTTALFEREGFRPVAETAARSAGLPRWLMRLDLTSSS